MKKQLFYLFKNELWRGNKAYIESVEDFCFHFASFDNLEQAKRFFRIFKAKLSLVREEKEFFLFECDLSFIDGSLFCKLSDLPAGVKKIKALSNGSIVNCYYKKTKKKVVFYRPNPNAKEVYKPLDVDKHAAFRKANGIY